MNLTSFPSRTCGIAPAFSLESKVRRLTLSRSAACALLSRFDRLSLELLCVCMQSVRFVNKQVFTFYIFPWLKNAS
jgi:hypothetical protein